MVEMQTISETSDMNCTTTTTTPAVAVAAAAVVHTYVKICSSLKTVALESTIFWDVTQCSLVEVHGVPPKRW
jgi:hypothetical protein